jgi:hypothetical protein
MWCRYHLKCNVCGKATNLRLHIAGSKYQDINFLCGECKSTIGGRLELIPEKTTWKFTPSNCVHVKGDFFTGGDYFVEYSEAFPSKPPSKTPHHPLTPFMRNLPSEDPSGNPEDWILKPNEDEWRELSSLNRAYLSRNKTFYDKISDKYEKKVSILINYDKKDMDDSINAIHTWYFGEFLDLLEQKRNFSYIRDYLLTRDAVVLIQRFDFACELKDKEFLDKCKREIFNIFEDISTKNNYLRPAILRENGKQFSSDDEFIPNEDFSSVRSIYTNIFESLGRLLTIPFGLDNIDREGSYDSLPHGIPTGNGTWEDFLLVDQGKKMNYFNSNLLWRHIYRDSYDNCHVTL